MLNSKIELDRIITMGISGLIALGIALVPCSMDAFAQETAESKQESPKKSESETGQDSANETKQETQIQTKRIRVKRARKPTFNKRQWEGIFFENLFAEGLNGERPANFGENKKQSMAQNGETLESASDDGSPNSDDVGEITWSRLVAATVLEDEVKRLQITLNQQVTVPAKFNSDYKEAQLTFATLSILFAVIQEYDKDVRWKTDALNAQAAFYRAASFPSNKLSDAFEFSRVRKESLTELVRGSGFPPDETAGDSIDWESVTDRSPLMERLEISLYDRLEKWVSNESEFNKNLESLAHEAQLVAMMGHGLAQEGMDDAEDEDYRALAQSMMNAAQDVANGAKTMNYELASKGVNLMGQSCTNCHDEWR